jgi:hypothetical protein
MEALAFGVLAMTKLQTLSEEESSNFGEKEVNKLTDFLGEAATNKSQKTSNRLIDPVACRAEWQTAKQLVCDNKYINTSTRVLYKQLYQYHKDALPNLLLLAELASFFLSKRLTVRGVSVLEMQSSHQKGTGWRKRA